METVVSNTNCELDEKIKNKVKPEGIDKKKLQSRIKQLDKKQHLHLFHTIIKPLGIYTVTDNGTFFDLNELTLEQFWELNYQVNLTHDCIKREKQMNELSSNNANVNNNANANVNANNNANNRLYNHEFDIESTSLYEPNNDLELEEPILGSNCMTYSQLRDATLNGRNFVKNIEVFCVFLTPRTPIMMNPILQHVKTTAFTMNSFATF